MIQLYELSGKNDLRFSPPCCSVKLCLIHKNIKFETVPVKFSEKNKISFSNQKLVPVLKFKDEFVSDSWNIYNWLDENFNHNKLFVNENSKNFSYFLYLWTSRQLLPVLFKIIADEIPNILEKKDRDYFIKTREERINGPITKYKTQKDIFAKEFRKLINPIRKLIEKNGFISGNNPNIEDYIFFGNLKWVYSCSSYQLLVSDDPVYKWYSEIIKLTSK